jgi:hypothetical protein
VLLKQQTACGSGTFERKANYLYAAQLQIEQVTEVQLDTEIQGPTKTIGSKQVFQV